MVSGWIGMALALSTWGADSASVVFHEIHYRSPTGDSQDEFIELRNLGQAPVDLRGWTVSGGIEFQFLNPAVLESNGLLVVAANPDRIRAVHGSGIRMEGPWKGRLGNSGETLVLRSANGNEVDRVAYAEDGDWSYRMRGPIDGGHRGLVWNGAHDGGGASLELVQPGLPNDLGANWAASRTRWSACASSLASSLKLSDSRTTFVLVPIGTLNNRRLPAEPRWVTVRGACLTQWAGQKST